MGWRIPFLGKPKTLSDCAATLPLFELVKRTRIVVIDDVKSEFPFKILQSQGYSIDHWSDVTDLPKLESGFYDIIILDIGGIGSALDKENEGAAILTHLKRVNPAQVIIAHSGQSHESKRIPFFKLADQYVPKPTNAITWKEILDDVILSKVTVTYLWQSVHNILSSTGVSSKKISELESKIVKQLEKKGKQDSGELVRSTLGTVDKLTTIAGIIGKIVILCTSA